MQENKDSAIFRLSMEQKRLRNADFLSRVNHSSLFLHRVPSFLASFNLYKAYSIFSVLAQSSCLCCLNSGFTEVRFSCPSLKMAKKKKQTRIQNGNTSIHSAAKHWFLKLPDSTHLAENYHVNMTTKSTFRQISVA